MGDTDTQLAVIWVTCDTVLLHGCVAVCPGWPEQGGQRKPEDLFLREVEWRTLEGGLGMQAAMTKVQIWGPSLGSWNGGQSEVGAIFCSVCQGHLSP